VYAVPFVSPVTVLDVADGLLTWIGVCAFEPMNGVTEYAVIALPPSLDGAVQLTSAWPVAGLADTFWGADGALAEVGVTAFDRADAGPLPEAFEACTTNV
jgi:hypothetical protein